MTDDDADFDALLARKAAGDLTVEVEIAELLDHRAAEWDGIVSAAGDPVGPGTLVVEGPTVDRPVAARVRVDGESTSIVLAEHLGGSEREAALEGLWRRTWRAHGGGGSDAA